MSMNRVLSIPEFLDIIFSYADRACNVNNACVCKQWSNIALEALWREVEDVIALFNILVPIKFLNYQHIFEFSRTPNLEDWTRFTRYARCVRRLRIKEKVRRCYEYIFNTVAVTRTSLVLFPNMHTLECISRSSTEHCALFMHGSVKKLVASIPYDTMSGRLRLIKDITSRMPHLTELDLCIHTQMSYVECDIIQLLQGLPELTKVIFPKYHLTGRIVQTLSRLENIQVIRFKCGKQQGIGNRADMDLFFPVLETGAFQSLWDLSLSVHLKDATSFFQNFSPINLTILHVDPHMAQELTMLKEFLVAISNNCQALERLVLKLLAQANLLLDSHQADAKMITFDTLRPLLDCSNLTWFELTNVFPVKVSLEELEEFARNWPSLEVLLLNCEPISLQTPKLGLSAFLPFAEHCPNIRHLGLFIYASADDLPSLKDRKLFKNLRKLSMGVSDISDEGKVAFFLEKLCPAINEVNCGVTWQYFLENDTGSLAAEVGRRCKKWEEAKKLLLLLMHMRLEKGGSSRALASKVEVLRVRTQILMEHYT